MAPVTKAAARSYLLKLACLPAARRSRPATDPPPALRRLPPKPVFATSPSYGRFEEFMSIILIRPRHSRVTLA